MSNVNHIIEQQKRKQQLWMLQAKQEKQDEDDPIDVQPEEYLCPICYEMYNNQDHKPLVLFPCGHSVCEYCKKKSEEVNYGKPSKCCYCNQKYTSSTINYALLNVMEKQVATPQNAPKKCDFKDELQIAIQRYGLLSRQLAENVKKSKELKSNLKSETLLIEHIHSEMLYIQEQYKEHKDTLEVLKEQDKDLDKKIKSLQDIIGPLTTEIEKLKLLVQGQEAE